jgi:hypothetical protein
MDHVRAFPENDPCQPGHRDKVARRADPPAEIRKTENAQAWNANEVFECSFVGRGHAMNEQRLHATPVQPVLEDGGVPRGTPNVQSGDDAERLQ